MFNKIKRFVEKDSDASQMIENLVLKCKKRTKIILVKKYNFIRLSNKFGYLIKILLFKDNLYLYLLRNNLYRILNDSIKKPNFRKLVKSEIFKAPKGTFSEFVLLFNELKNELLKISNNQSSNSINIFE